MSETPTNRTPEVISLPNGTCCVDTGVGRTVFASPAPAPKLLSAERLAEILADDTAYGTLTNFAPELVWQRRQLLRHAVALKFALNQTGARAAEAEAQVVMLKTELAEQEVEKLALVKELGKAKQDLGYAAVKVGLLLGDLAIAKRNGPL